MKRHTITPRADWQKKVESIGLTFHSHDNSPYWDESAAYEFTGAEVDELEQAANTLHKLCIDAAGAVIENGWWQRLAIPEAAIPVIMESWERDDFSLYGRFDLAYDGKTPPKMLEYNADTPTALIEAAVAQWFWLEEVKPKADQFNSIHERLIEAWKRLKKKTIHFTSVAEMPEDEQTLFYLQDTCVQAGIKAKALSIADLGWDKRRERFVDLDEDPIDACFKLYPWEWLWAEPFAVHLPKEAHRFLEPAWKMLLSNKGLLPILWELFPGHPNLLPCSDQPMGDSYVRKPKLSREGNNVTLVEAGNIVEKTEGIYGDEGYVYQAVADLPRFGDNVPVCGVWIIDHEAAGMGIREDTKRITGNMSRFVPHWFA
jgi:glutathionylspermidine synthase